PEKQSRWLAPFRILLFVPIAVAYYLISAIGSLAGATVFVAWVSLLSNRRYPRLIFPWVVWWNRLNTQVGAYLLLVTDEFPFDERDRPLKYDVEYTAPHGRLGVFFRIILIIPHVIVLLILFLALLVVTLIALIAIVITATYPKGLWEFSVGVQRWSARVGAYSGLLTDRYPPFSLN
ncbi:MAG: DUF4389 domain-containing protein, partial [Dehalococcoidia bacterium]